MANSDFGPRAIIDCSALRHNLGVAKQRSPGSRVIAVIKANAYGHGSVPTASALSAADAFGVARLTEALRLREHGLAQPILLLEGVFSHHELDVASSRDFQIVVHSPEQLAMLREWRGTGSLHVWLKVDTGMNRLGIRTEECEAAWRALSSCAAVAASPRLMTHLAAADDSDSEQTSQQLARFTGITASLAAERSIANSAGLLAWPSARVEWVRPGLMLYGISPFADKEASDYGLLPAMHLVTRVIAVRSVKAGEAVGYGGAWVAPHDARVAIAAIGYGDGYPRQIVSGSPVKIGSAFAPIVGRVSMDMIAIDVSSLMQTNVGDEVTLWGPGLPVERLARCAGTIPYELVCGISQRVAIDYRS